MDSLDLLRKAAYSCFILFEVNVKKLIIKRPYALFTFCQTIPQLKDFFFKTRILYQQACKLPLKFSNFLKRLSQCFRYIIEIAWQL